jgi:hypothetical protein
MTYDGLRELNKKRKIHQIAWVTRDLEKSMKAWVDNLKVGSPSRHAGFVSDWILIRVVNKHVAGADTNKPPAIGVSVDG